MKHILLAGVAALILSACGDTPEAELDDAYDGGGEAAVETIEGALPSETLETESVAADIEAVVDGDADIATVVEEGPAIDADTLSEGLPESLEEKTDIETLEEVAGEVLADPEAVVDVEVPAVGDVEVPTVGDVEVPTVGDAELPTTGDVEAVVEEATEGVDVPSGDDVIDAVTETIEEKVEDVTEDVAADTPQ